MNTHLIKLCAKNAALILAGWAVIYAICRLVVYLIETVASGGWLFYLIIGLIGLATYLAIDQAQLELLLDGNEPGEDRP